MKLNLLIRNCQTECLTSVIAKYAQGAKPWGDGGRSAGMKHWRYSGSGSISGLAVWSWKSRQVDYKEHWMITLHTAGVTLENKISSNRMMETVSLSKFISTYSFQHDCTCMNESVDYRPLCLMKIRMQDDQNPPMGRADSTGGMNFVRTTRFGGEPQGKAANYVNKE